MKTTYTLTVRTANRLFAGTDGNISVILRGELGETAAHVLDRALHDDLRAGAVDVFEIHDEDVGELVAVRVRNTPTVLKDDWLLEYLVVECGGIERRFPLHAWIKGAQEVELLEASASLPQKVRSPERLRARRENVVHRQARYRWGASAIEGLGQLDVSEAHPLPEEEAYRGLVDRSYHVTFAETMSKLQLARPLLLHAWNGVERLKDLLTFVGVPAVAERWRDDREFARHTLQGVSPQCIAQARALPEGMTLTDAELRGLLDPGIDLARALATSRMYLLDLPILEGLPMFRHDDGERSAQRALTAFAPACSPMMQALHTVFPKPVLKSHDPSRPAAAHPF